MRETRVGTEAGEGTVRWRDTLGRAVVLVHSWVLHGLRKLA